MNKKKFMETIKVIIENTQGIELTEQYMNKIVMVAVKSLTDQLINGTYEECAKQNKKFAWWLSINYSRFHDSWYMSNNNGKHDNPYETKQPFISWEEVLKIYKSQSHKR